MPTLGIVEALWFFPRGIVKMTAWQQFFLFFYFRSDSTRYCTFFCQHCRSASKTASAWCSCFWQDNFLGCVNATSKLQSLHNWQHMVLHKKQPTLLQLWSIVQWDVLWTSKLFASVWHWWASLDTSLFIFIIARAVWYSRFIWFHVVDSHKLINLFQAK